MIDWEAEFIKSLGSMSTIDKLNVPKPAGDTNKFGLSKIIVKAIDGEDNILVVIKSGLHSLLTEGDWRGNVLSPRDCEILISCLQGSIVQRHKEGK